MTKEEAIQQVKKEIREDGFEKLEILVTNKMNNRNE